MYSFHYSNFLSLLFISASSDTFSSVAKIEAPVKTDLTTETELSTKSESGTKVN